MKILFFANLKTMVGRSEIEFDLRDQSSADELWTRLLSLHPELQSQRDQVRLAANCEFAGPSTLFNNSDEVALIPPVSGG